MAMDPSVRFTLPRQFSGVQCANKYMMYIASQENFLATLDYALQDLTHETCTDVTLVPAEGWTSSQRVHSLLLAAASPLLAALLADRCCHHHHPTLFLPEVPLLPLASLCQLLYGAAVIVTKDMLDVVLQIVDHLGITLEIEVLLHKGTEAPRRKEEDVRLAVHSSPPSQQSDANDREISQAPDTYTADSCRPRTNYTHQQDSDLPDAEPMQLPRPARHREQTRNAEAVHESEPTVLGLKDSEKRQMVSGTDAVVKSAAAVDGERELPLCCWFCNTEFASFQLLSEHSGSCEASARRQLKQGRQRRCPRCGEVVASMWKLRQHLSRHQTLSNNKQGDHPYAGRSRGARRLLRNQSGDHGYATAQKEAMMPGGEPLPQAEQGNQCSEGGATLEQHLETPEITRNEPEVKPATLESSPAVSFVCCEHSYGTKRDSSPEPEPEDGERLDHPYSAPQQTSKKPSGPASTSSPSKKIRSRRGFLTPKKQGGPNASQLNILSTERQNRSSRGQKAQENDKAACAASVNIDPSVDPPGLELKLAQDSAEEEDRAESLTATSPPPTAHACSQCPKVFPAAYRLNRHVREVHNKEKLHKCNQCTKEFFKSTSLLRHIVAVHAKLRPYLCQRCQAGFKDPTALKYHIRMNVCSARPAKA